ncbi:MAG: enoyl-CoA hydratase/isomerase family protein [Planctomycetes bacterium]|nr:enoyl-CoA hydratase/isomerase family protein [Planctomycetota bacterium]
MNMLKKIGVIGAGTMGSGIVQKIAQEDLAVIMVDVSDAMVTKGIASIKKLLAEAVERKIFSPEKAQKTLNNITVSTNYDSLADCDMVIEAVFEDKKIKQDLFQKLDSICKSDTIFATNTSSFRVAELGNTLKRKDGFIGLHFFYHPAKNRLLEVIPVKDTRPDVLESGFRFAKLIGKVGIRTKDAPGFAVNRFFVPWLNEAVRILEDGIADIPSIEEAAKKAFKIGMGPFELMNVTGIPIAFHSTASLGSEFGRFYAPAPALKKQFESKQNWNLSGVADETKSQVIADRLLGAVFLAASQLVDEGVAVMEDTDRGAKVGLRWLFGPFELMNKSGIRKSFELVKAFCARYDCAMPEMLSKQAGTGVNWNFQFVDLTIKNSIATITVNRPEAMNALNETVVTQLENAFSEAEKNPDAKVIAITGAGKAFVAGADIRFFIKNIEQKNLDRIFDFTKRGQELLKRIENSLKTTVAVMDGLALGGGVELALACRAIIATNRCTMGFPETGIGIYPGLGGTQRTPRIAGKELAKYLVFTGKTLTAEEAHRFGLVTFLMKLEEIEPKLHAIAAGEKVPDKYAPKPVAEELKPLARIFADNNMEALLTGRPAENATAELLNKTAKAISYKAPIAVRLANKIIDEGMKKDLNGGLDVELSYLKEIFSTADAYEGLTSLGKKRPEYKNR